MHIETIQTQTGRQIRDAILARFQDRDIIKAAAEQEPHGAAHDALYWLDNFEEDPSLLDQTITTSTVTQLEPADVRLLTPQRLALLDALNRTPHASVSQLQRLLRRDYKRVQTDVDILERLGALTTRREGRRRIVDPLGNELRLTFQ